MNIEGQWAMYGWAAAVALAIVAGIWSATTHHDRRPVLPPEHVAGAVFVGLFGWELLVGLPGVVTGYMALTAGLGDWRGLQAEQAFLAAQAAFAAGAAFAVVGILRRHTWGAVLGIGLAASMVVSSTLNIANITATMAESMGSDIYWNFIVSIFGLQVIPALVAVVLLLLPFARSTTPEIDAASEMEAPAG